MCCIFHVIKWEEREDELRDSVNSLTQERDDLLDQLGDSQANMASQEAQIKYVLVCNHIKHNTLSIHPNHNYRLLSAMARPMI